MPLQPRSLAMWRYLAAHPGRLVTKVEVHQYVWVGMHVPPNVLRVCVREMRAALGDSTVVPRDLEAGAVHRARWGGRTIALARPMASSTGTSANREARLRMAVSFHIAKMNSIN